MRDYLFRGKRKDNDKWVYGSLIHVGDFCCILSEDNGTNYDYPYLDADLGCIDGYVTPVIPETVGQFTGVSDKNDKKIFEGDVVRAMMDYGPAGFYETIAKIMYYELDGYQWNYFDMNAIEIIGNVYDNPELLDNIGLVEVSKGV